MAGISSTSDKDFHVCGSGGKSVPLEGRQEGSGAGVGSSMSEWLPVSLMVSLTLPFCPYTQLNSSKNTASIVSRMDGK